MFKAGDRVYVDTRQRYDLPGVVTDVYGMHVLVRIEASYLGFDVDAILTFHADKVRVREANTCAACGGKLEFDNVDGYVCTECGAEWPSLD